MGADAFGYQAVKAVGVPKQVGAVLTLNQSFDTAALGRHHVFSSQMEWITETVAWVLKNTDDTVVVRQHPIERHKAHAGNDGYAQVLQRTL